MRALTAAAALCLSACSTTNTMNGIMESWQDRPLREVVSQWGYPDSQQPFQGNTLYFWDYRKSVALPQQSTTTASVTGNTAVANTVTTGGGTFHGQCVRILEVNPQDLVVGWNWKGNNCPFGELMEYSNWRRKG